MTFGVDTDTMATGATRVGVAIERIDDMLERIRGDVATMLSAWSGGGAQAHRALHERFDKDVTTINASLLAVQEALQQTHSVYTNQESQQTTDHTNMRNQVIA